MYPSRESILACHDCKIDTYDPHYLDVIEVIQTGTCSRLIPHTGSSLQENELKSLKKEANVFTVQKCPNNVTHLWRGQEKVLMVKESYNLIQELHGDNHLLGDVMLDIIKKYPIHIQSIFNFVTEFPYTCGVCLTQGLKPGPCISSFWSILENRFQVNLRHILRE